MFALSETFHGDYPPHEPGTGMFTGSVICEIADSPISSGSFRWGKGLILTFQHGKEHAGCLILVNLPVILRSESQAPKSEDGEFRFGLFHFPVEHCPSPISVIRIACAILYKCLHGRITQQESEMV